MKSWHKVTAFLCVYGIFKEIRPSEPYLTEYLEGPWINLTSSQVDHEVYPIWTYSYLLFLAIVLLVTDFLRYKPILIIEGLSYIATWCLLLFTQSLFSMQIMQAFYGIATATEVAYYTYIYSIVSTDEFQKVTSFTRASLLFGRFISGLTSQLLISTKTMDFHSLNYISFTSVTISFLMAIILPQPAKGLYQWSASNKDAKACDCQFKKIFQFILRELKKSYSNRDLFLWSLWWAFATSGNIQVGNYVQPLWETIEPTWDSVNSTAHSTSIYNGAVEATHTLLGSMAAMGLSMVHIHFLKYTETLLGVLSLIDCLLLFAMAMTTEIWIAYICYITFRTTYQMMITVVSYNVAKSLDLDTYGLIFGANTFFALIIQTLMTVIIVDKNGLHLDTRTQFVTYSVYFGCLTMLFVVIGLCKCYHFSQGDHLQHYPLEEELQDSGVEK